MDSLDQTPEMALKEALDAAERESPDKVMIVFLWDANGEYDTRFFNAGLNCSQMISLCEIQKAKCIELMRPPTND